MFYLNEFILLTNEILYSYNIATCEQNDKRVLRRQYGGASTVINSFPILRYIETNNSNSIKSKSKIS